MLELYHHALSTCSQKVRLVLAEKGLDFESRIVDLIAGGQHAPDYVKLNPNHVVPTLVHDGTVLIESSLINEYLDDAFPDPPLRPADPAARHALRLWVKRIDEKVHPSASVLTFAIGARPAVLAQPEEVRQANIEAIPDPGHRAARRSVIEHGVDAPEFAGALGRFLDLLDVMQASLAPDRWLSGDAFGLADAAVLPYVLRLDHLAMTPLLDARPAVADWYARVQARPSFETAVTAWAPEPIVKLFRGNGEAVWPQVEPLTRR
ncbi:MAG: glutathione S-transferase family protein [Deltaproteobacteria bacterium]|nr:glutathione S-transferase family protein [Deltaproteobacteria bacterium]MBW2414647.1 glutathione S-transferase family protein [Deltaproteobacteria bacterium]